MSAAVSLPAMRTCDEDGSHHFSHVKRLNLSAKQYLHAVNAPNEPTRPMLVSTAVHQIVLGPRAGKRVVVFDGDRRGTNAWKDFASKHDGADILTAPEWAEAREIAEAIGNDPLVRTRLDGARKEVPLEWEDGGLKCSTSGIDILGHGALGDLKGTHTSQPDAFMRTAFRMLYHVQLCWYRRGAIANGVDVSRGLFVLGYEMKAPFEVVDLEMTERLVELGDQTLTVWLEKLRVYRESNEWPGYCQSPIPWDVPRWMQDDEDDDEEAIS